MAKKKQKTNRSMTLLAVVISVLAYFIGLAVVFIICSFLLMYPEQCPAHYTQEQVDAEGCNVGANIGGGIIMLFGLPIAAVALLFPTIGLYRRLTSRKP